MESVESRSIVLFDGECRLCSGWVRFLLPRDPVGRFVFAPLQADSAARVLGLEPGVAADRDSVILLERGRVYTRSAAVLRVCRQLPGLWPVLSVFLLVPRPLRDYVYDVIARNRARWFGQNTACYVPTEAERERFLN